MRTLFAFVMLVVFSCVTCMAGVPPSALRVRVSDWQYALASRDVGVTTLAGQTPQPGQKYAQIEVTNLSQATATFATTIVIRGRAEDQTGLIAGTVRAGSATMVFIPYDSRAGPFRFGVRVEPGETIHWLE